MLDNSNDEIHIDIEGHLDKPVETQQSRAIESIGISLSDSDLRRTQKTVSEFRQSRVSIFSFSSM